MYKYLGLGSAFILMLYEAYLNNKYMDKIIPPNFHYFKYALIFSLFIFGGLDIYTTRFNTSNWHHGEISGSELDTPVLKLGSANFVPQGELETLFQWADDPIQIWCYDGKLQLTSIVRNKNGEIVVQISGNKFIVNPNTISDFNYDSRALEVLDKSGDVVFQIIMQKDGVLYCGKFYTLSGTSYAIGTNAFEVRPENTPLETNFEKILLYPRWRNLGIRKTK